MKKILIFVIMLCIGIIDVNASTDIYYTNHNNVNFTEKQYNFFSKMYFEGYQEYVTQEDFDLFSIEEMNPSLVETVYIEDRCLSRGSFINDSNKTLKISKTSISNESNITILASWNNNPSVKSYDVIGARLVNTSLLNTPVTKVINSSGSKSYSVNVNSNNGFGTSVLLSGNNIKVTQTFRVKNGGTVYGSYQHAMSNISLANSKKYTISSSGYGSVFAFTGTATNVYDQMSGVSISV